MTSIEIMDDYPKVQNTPTKQNSLCVACLLGRRVRFGVQCPHPRTGGNRSISPAGRLHPTDQPTHQTNKRTKQRSYAQKRVRTSALFVKTRKRCSSCGVGALVHLIDVFVSYPCLLFLRSCVVVSCWLVLCTDRRVCRRTFIGFVCLWGRLFAVRSFTCT